MSKTRKECLGCGLEIWSREELHCIDCQRLTPAFVAVCGSVFNGVRLYGPFESEEEFSSWRGRNLRHLPDDTYELVPISWSVREPRCPACGSKSNEGHDESALVLICSDCGIHFDEVQG
jgi:hypothetical protein